MNGKLADWFAKLHDPTHFAFAGLDPMPIYLAMIFLAATIYPNYFELPETMPIVLLEDLLVIVAVGISFLLINGYLLATHGQTVGLGAHSFTDLLAGSWIRPKG